MGIAMEYPALFSRTHVQKLIKNGNILVNGKICDKPSFKSELATTVNIHYELPQEYTLHGNSEFSVPVLYQDEHLAVIHKPPGMTVHPGAGTKEDTLVHVLLSQIETLSEGSDKLRPGIVHRLDRETEGLMIIAKNNHAHFILAEAFAERKIIKEYSAWVWGLTEPVKEVSGYIGRHPKDRKKMLFEFVPFDDTYKTAIMSYQTVDSTKYFSMLKINLQTGRTHQIRATLAKLNNPVLGDAVYSSLSRKLEKTEFNAEQKQRIAAGGLYLIASRLTFDHPITQKSLDFQLPLPERFDTIKKLG
jgi:23S rRNA pseudouridine1911/1915/1917 synthase